MLADKNIGAVLIATRHNQHAAQVVQALQAGKHVWIEKPLALTRTELAEIESAYTAAVKKFKYTPVLMVGFNRRFAPAVVALKHHLNTHAGSSPKQVLVRVNAGKLESSSWQNTPEGGGRLLGEVCHFTDLALHLQGSPVAHVHIVHGAGQDVYSITLHHTNGGLSSILYSSEGDPAAPKEYVEVLAGGALYTLNNYASTTVSVGGKLKTLYQKPTLGATNKGHAAALAAWVAACQGRADAPVPLPELLASSALVLEE
jgi:predicted dehydrogenase